MTDFVLTADKKEKILECIRSIEKLVALSEEEERLKSEKLLASTDSIAPVLRTALVINWKESAMKPRYERFRWEFPEINSLEKLKELMDSTEPVSFCEKYLNIKATLENNPKFILLKTLVNGFLEYKEEIKASSEIDAIRQWAKNVDISNLHNDPIGKLKGVGIGVVENIRLNLGYSVIKPDRHVIGVMKQCLGVDIPPEHYAEFSQSIGFCPRYLDLLLFQYGKLKNISDKPSPQCHPMKMRGTSRL